MQSIVISLALNSCEKAEVEPKEYSVIVTNSYFERIDSVNLSTYELKSIEISKSSIEINLNKGNYPFTFISASGLGFESTVAIKGLRENLQIIVNENGEITIE